jgi:ankyrin
VNHFEAALRLDSQYSQAHAALAAVYWEAWDNHWTEALNISSLEAMESAKQHLHKAMKQPSSLAHWVASNILIAEGDYQTAVTEARQIVALDSNNADGYATLANALALSGKSDESARLIGKAVRLNPNSSPLQAATKKGDANDVRRLIAEGLHIDAKDYFGKTALHVAAETGQAEIAALLIEAGADIEAGAPGYPDLRFNGATPLIIAALLGQTTVAELLISAGADVNAQNTDILAETRSVLHNAVKAGNKEVAELLIVNGAYVDAVTRNRLQTPLFVAARTGHRDMVELLISKDANVNAANFNAVTPLYIAVVSGDFDTVQLLIANGADVHAKLLGGETPLHATAYSGNTRIAVLLLANGVEINAADQYGYTPLRRAVDEGQLAMAELLIKEGADITTRDKYGITPLHIIAQTDRIAIAELLISSGADINVKDANSGFTPLDYAQDGDEGMIDTLERHGGACTIC